jgi:hypothetical protein
MEINILCFGMKSFQFSGFGLLTSTVTMRLLGIQIGFYE